MCDCISWAQDGILHPHYATDGRQSLVLSFLMKHIHHLDFTSLEHAIESHG